MVFWAFFRSVSCNISIPSSPFIEQSATNNTFSVCLISILRIVSLSSLDYTDLPYQSSFIATWGAAEVNLAIICACLPTLKPLVVRFFPNLLGPPTDKTHDPATRTIGGGGGPAARHLRHRAVDEQSFDDEWLKTDEDEDDWQSVYEMESQPDKRSVVTTPTKHLDSGA